MPSFDFSLETQAEEFRSITDKVRTAIKLSKITDGLCTVFCPHTTAGITINENADPDVVTDMLYGLSKVYPEDLAYRHMEGNTTAHLKASAVGSSVTVIVANGKPILGRWQGIYFCEFDGPRDRTFFVQVIGT